MHSTSAFIWAMMSLVSATRKLVPSEDHSILGQISESEISTAQDLYNFQNAYYPHSFIGLDEIGNNTLTITVFRTQSNSAEPVEFLAKNVTENAGSQSLCDQLAARTGLVKKSTGEEDYVGECHEVEPVEHPLETRDDCWGICNSDSDCSGTCSTCADYHQGCIFQRVCR